MSEEQNEKLRATIAGAALGTLDTIAQATYQAWARGEIDDDTGNVVTVAVEARRTELKARLAGDARPAEKVGGPGGSPERGASRRRHVGSRPTTSASISRRRRWCASGWLPPSIAENFTQGERAALSVYAIEVASRGLCRHTIGHVAAAAGVSRTLVKRAVRLAQDLKILSSEEWRISRWRSAPNTVRIISPEWLAWLRTRFKSATRAEGGAVTFVSTSNTKNKSTIKVAPSHSAARIFERKGGRSEPFFTPELLRATEPWRVGTARAPAAPRNPRLNTAAASAWFAGALNRA